MELDVQRGGGNPAFITQDGGGPQKVCILLGKSLAMMVLAIRSGITPCTHAWQAARPLRGGPCPHGYFISGLSPFIRSAALHVNT